MIDINKCIQKIVAIAALVVSSNSLATQDAETPEQVLEMVRLFLSNPTIAAEVSTLAQKGCVWTSEVVWFGSGDEVSEGIYTAGGGFTINYMSKSGNKLQRSFGWQGLRSHNGVTVAEVQSAQPVATEVDCA